MKELHDAIMDVLWKSFLLVVAVWAALVFGGVVVRLYT